MSKLYKIGTPGQPWGAGEKKEWSETCQIQRSYNDEVLVKLDALKQDFEVFQYGALDYPSLDAQRYPLMGVRTRGWDPSKPYVLVTGGVHGYEKSGVQGAIKFLQKEATRLSEFFNILVLPCVSPWGYETIQRWNPEAIDPNRSFNPQGEDAIVPGRSHNPEALTRESRAVLNALAGLDVEQWLMHIDLHETTNSDLTEFCPAKAARDGALKCEIEEIPDGFYLHSVAQDCMEKPQADWCRAMIDAVRQVTHIATQDAQGEFAGVPAAKGLEGVTAFPFHPRDAGICFGLTNAKYLATTEVYPDSEKVTSEEECNDAQVACVAAGLEHLRREHGL